MTPRTNAARRNWYYCPIPKEQEEAINEIIKNKMSPRYGISDKTDMIRLIIGQFIRRYDLYGELPLDSESLRLLRPFELKNVEELEEEENSNQIVK